MRTSGQAVSMSISATDGAGATVIAKTPISLAAISNRRLAKAATPKKEEAQLPMKEADLLEDEDTDDAWELEEEEGEDDLQELDDEEDIEENRPLRPHLNDRREGRLLRKGGGGFGGRSRGGSSKSSPSRSRPAPAPPKYQPSDPRSYGDARRRANPTTARRRDSPPPSGLRRRVNSVDDKRYGNPSNPSAGAYGYTSSGSQKLSTNFPSGHQSTSYGYSGGRAHTGSSSRNIMMAAAAGGALGLGAGYMYGSNWDYSYSRWNRRGWGWKDKNCDSPSGTSINCEDCFEQYDNCQLTVGRDAGRDDLMATGFIPYDYQDSLVFRIENITGDDYDATNICPPAGWSGNISEWVDRPTFQDIWLRFTTLEELEEELQNDVNAASSCATLSIPFFVIAGFRIFVKYVAMS